MKIHLSLAELNAYDPHDGHRRLCPLCGDDKPRDSGHRSLSFDAQTGLWKCFRCGESGKLREFWQEQEEFQPPRQRARARLQQAFSLTAHSPANPPSNTPLAVPVTLRVPPVIMQPASGLPVTKQPVSTEEHSLWQMNWEAATPLAGTRGEAYLGQRGIPLAVAEAAEVRFSPAWFNQASVVFPLKNRQNEIIAAQGRAVRGNAKLTSGPKRNGVFFAPALKSHARDKTDVFRPFDSVLPAVILTEAPIDALSLAACGFPALALCGTSGPDWLHIACGLRRVLLAFDADDAGDQAAITIADRLQPFGSKCQRLIPSQGKDWNEALMVMGSASLTDELMTTILLT